MRAEGPGHRPLPPSPGCRAASLQRVRPVTRLLLIGLFVLIVVAAIAQFTMGGPEDPYPGPVSGTPLPSLSASP